MLRALRQRMGAADITIAHGSSTGLACAFTGRRFVYRQISDSRFWAGTWPRRLRVAAYLRRARRIVALSAGAKAALVEHLWLPAGRIQVVPNGVPVGAFHVPSAGERASARAAVGLPAEGFVALYIGALVPEKGVDVAIRALAGVPAVTLAIAGGGPDRDRLEGLAGRRRPGGVPGRGRSADAGLRRGRRGAAAQQGRRQHAGHADRGRLLRPTRDRDADRFDRGDRAARPHRSDRAGWR